MRFVIRATWSAPITPTPRMAMRRSDIVVPVLLLEEFHGGNTARAEIPAGALGDRQVLGAPLRLHLGIDLLEVQIADPLRGTLDDRDVVAAAVADVAGVQAEIHELAVGAVEKAVDVLLGVDVAV